MLRKGPTYLQFCKLGHLCSLKVSLNVSIIDFFNNNVPWEIFDQWLESWRAALLTSTSFIDGFSYLFIDWLYGGEWHCTPCIRCSTSTVSAEYKRDGNHQGKKNIFLFLICLNFDSPLILQYFLIILWVEATIKALSGQKGGYEGIGNPTFS